MINTINTNANATSQPPWRGAVLSRFSYPGCMPIKRGCCCLGLVHTLGIHTLCDAQLIKPIINIASSLSTSTTPSLTRTLQKRALSAQDMRKFAPIFAAEHPNTLILPDLPVMRHATSRAFLHSFTTSAIAPSSKKHRVRALRDKLPPPALVLCFQLLISA